MSNHEDRINQLEKHIQSAEWTRRHELAWEKLRYADKLNPLGWRPLTGDVTIESAERALKEVCDDLWSWKRKPEEKAR